MYFGRGDGADMMYLWEVIYDGIEGRNWPVKQSAMLALVSLSVRSNVTAQVQWLGTIEISWFGKIQ